MSAVTPPEGAPQTETPENPAAAPAQAPVSPAEPAQETPESPAAPPQQATQPENQPETAAETAETPFETRSDAPEPAGAIVPEAQEEAGGLDTTPEPLRISPHADADPLVQERVGVTNVIPSPPTNASGPSDTPGVVGQNPPVNSHAPARYETVETGAPAWPYASDGTIPEGVEAAHIQSHIHATAPTPQPLPHEVYDAQAASLAHESPEQRQQAAVATGSGSFDPGHSHGSTTPPPPADPDPDLATGADEAKQRDTAAAEMGGEGEQTA